MTTVALNNLWQYLQNLSLTENNKRWLVQKLTESKSENKTVNAKTKAAIEELDKGQGTVCHSWDEFLEAVK